MSSTLPPAPARLPSAAPPGARPLLHRAHRRVHHHLSLFMRHELASGLVLMGAAALAMAWANSPWRGGYHALLHAPVEWALGSWRVQHTFEWLVNDVLMAVFFFVVGMEIRHEVQLGELSDVRRAALPAAAALGGMIAPALVSLVLVSGTSAQRGWGVPMATDIAFALGVLGLLGKRVPPALRILLLALAVIDDLGAIVVIAAFYTDHVQPGGLLLSLCGLLSVVGMQAFGVRAKSAYVLPALCSWWGAYQAGIHPTIAGVALGLLTPVLAWREVETKSPASELVGALQPWVSFGIMPLFALCNAGVALDGVHFEGDALRAALGASLGLLLGKPLGVIGVSWLLLKLRWVQLPPGLGGRELVVLGLVAGIGFTMSLFVAALAFDDPQLLGATKLGVLLASCVAALLTLLLGRALLTPRGAAAPAGDA